MLKPLIARFVESALDAELSHHLEEESKNLLSKANKRNGQPSKKLRSESGEIEINYSRDITGIFEPVTVKKRQHELAFAIAEKNNNIMVEKDYFLTLKLFRKEI